MITIFSERRYSPLLFDTQSTFLVARLSALTPISPTLKKEDSAEILVIRSRKAPPRLRINKNMRTVRRELLKKSSSVNKRRRIC
jgi:hypothetical protein